MGEENMIPLYFCPECLEAFYPKSEKTLLCLTPSCKVITAKVLDGRAKVVYCDSSVLDEVVHG